MREALAWRPEVVVEIFITHQASDRHADLVGTAHAHGLPVHVVTDRAIAGLVETRSPQGIAAVCAPIEVGVDAALGGRAAALVAVLADVRDPGNAGTVIRCADAAGADAVILAGESVDLYNGKTIRASAGSIFHLPIARARNVTAVLDRCREVGLGVLAADGAGPDDLDRLDEALAAPTAWLFGNEAWGLPAQLAATADRVVRVPIHGRAESLNLASAAAICLYASARRQRASAYR